MKKQRLTLATISQAQLEQFLSELANLRTDPGSVLRFKKGFDAFIPPFDKSWLDVETAERASRRAEIQDALEKYKEEGNAEEFERVFMGTDPLETELTEALLALGGGDAEEFSLKDVVWVLILRIMLRGLWSEPDLRQREWRVFAIRNHLYNLAQDPHSVKDPLAIFHPAKLFRIPPPTAFEQALLHFIKNTDKARYCANPECPAPYFFIKRKNQRYCSEICAAPAQRELKRKWWAENGEGWRSARQEMMSSKKGRSKVKASGTHEPSDKTGRKKGR
jgi:hypothetical protein